MKVLKFGGTSIGSAQRMKSVAKLVNNNEPKIVVLSAMSGTTNALEEINHFLYKEKPESADKLIKQLQEKYYAVVEELFEKPEYKQKGKDLIETHFRHIQSFTLDLFTLFEERTIMAQGELISTALFHFYLEEQGISSKLIPALNFMRVDRIGEPDDFYIRENLDRELSAHPNEKLFITQGFICRNVYGEIDNLKRGGSDYTASLIGAATKAEEIQIWTDIDGFHNNDPRYVSDTSPVAQLSFEEAAELAYFGAKILHPASVLPAQENNIPVRLKNTLNPDAPGTLLTSTIINKGIKAVAAKDGITAIKIKSSRMLLAYGFLRKIFETFESYKTPIDMITTSEIAVSLTIDNTQYLKDIIEEIQHYGTVEVDEQQSIICVVGDFIADKPGMALKVMESLKEIPIRMISYGGSRHNISILINSSYKKQALEALSENLFS